MRKMSKRIFKILLSFFVLFTLISFKNSTNVKADNDPWINVSYVKNGVVNFVELNRNYPYYINGETNARSEAPNNRYNAYFDADTQSLLLKNYNGGYVGNNTSTFDFSIMLEGENYINSDVFDGIKNKGNLVITSTTYGQLQITGNVNRDADGYGIQTENDLTVTGSAAVYVYEGVNNGSSFAVKCKNLSVLFDATLDCTAYSNQELGSAYGISAENDIHISEEARVISSAQAEGILAVGFYAEGDVIVEDNAMVSADVESYSDNFEYYPQAHGIYANKDVIIANNNEASIKSKTYGTFSTGIYATNNVTIGNGAKVNIEVEGCSYGEESDAVGIYAHDYIDLYTTEDMTFNIITVSDFGTAFGMQSGSSRMHVENTSIKMTLAGKNVCQPYVGEDIEGNYVAIEQLREYLKTINYTYKMDSTVDDEMNRYENYHIFPLKPTSKVIDILFDESKVLPLKTSKKPIDVYNAFINSIKSSTDPLSTEYGWYVSKDKNTRFIQFVDYPSVDVIPENPYNFTIKEGKEYWFIFNVKTDDYTRWNDAVTFAVNGLSGDDVGYKAIIDEKGDVSYLVFKRVYSPYDISKATVTGISNKTYTGKAITQTPTVKLGTTTLKSGTDYTVSYKNNKNAGTATVTIKGTGNYTGTVTKTFKINPASIAKATVSGLANKTYTGKAITQTPTVKLGTTTLKSGTDYTVTYKNNKNVGTATVTITGKGNYTGTVSKTFKINANTKITLNKTEATVGTMNVGKYTNTLQLKATVTGNSNTKVTWTSSNASVAQVDANGKVTGVSDPKHTVTTVTITAKSADGKTATCKVTVEDPINAFVRRLYKYCFNRNPDKGGFNDWTKKLRSKEKTAAEVVQGFFESKEMSNLKLKNEDYVERCYLVLMDRKSDAGGKKYWLDKLAQGLSKRGLLQGFVDSNEFTKICKDFNIVKGKIKQ